jgi:hypothetical protein
MGTFELLNADRSLPTSLSTNSTLRSTWRDKVGGQAREAEQVAEVRRGFLRSSGGTALGACDD